MSCVRVCDRCGHQQTVDSITSTPMQILNMHLVESSGIMLPSVTVHIDLCHNCIFDVEQFMKTKITRGK